MNPRNALILLLSVVCLTAWWQVETRLSAARDLNLKLSMEAAYLVEIRDEKPQQPTFILSPADHLQSGGTNQPSVDPPR